ncbi:ORC-CDC6 family AAA ATPase, partial [Acinetobacter bereziniae]
MNLTYQELKDGNEKLGLYKAEWLSDKIFDYFSEPGYFHQLVNSRPCIIVGGRGTGKTTVLKSLSYEGQSSLNLESSPSEWNFYGLYWKVNLNRITSFVNRGLSDNEWQPYFIHYLNLILCHKLCQFAVWYEKTQNKKLNLNEKLLRKTVKTLNIPLEYVQNIEDLEDEIDILIAELESKLNTISSDDTIFLTMLGAPIDRVSDLLLQTPELNGKQFVFLIDEFENFEDYQQCIVNTLMKQINQLYTFKIGVRELGWRNRSTLRENEILNSPADYYKIDMRTIFQENSFSIFAKQVVESRLPELKKIGGIEKLLPSLAEEEEANILIGTDLESQIRSKLASLVSKKYLKLLEQKSIGHIYFIHYISISREESFIDNLINWLENEIEWKDRFNNYFHAYLFSIRKGKSGIRKYYTGWDTFILLANNNIRYLIELVNKSV